MENFNDLMLEALEDTLRRVLGENASKLIHSLTERRTSLKLKAIGNNIDGILGYLEKLLGKEGARIIDLSRYFCCRFFLGFLVVLRSFSDSHCSAYSKID